MFAQLGNTQYKAAFSPSAFTKDGEATLVEHPLIGRKPRIEAAGVALRTITISFFLHQEYCQVSSEIAKLEKARDTFEVMPLLWGNGTVEGDFIIQSMTSTGEWFDDEGNLLSASLSISLKEYVIQDRQDSDQQRAKANAAAVGDKKTAAKSNRVNPSACEKQIADYISIIKANGSRVDNYSRSYTSAAQVNSQMISHLNIIANISDKIADATLTYTSCVFDDSTLRNAARGVKQRADQLRAIVQANQLRLASSAIAPDVASVKAINLQLQAAITGLQKVANSKIKSSITRS